MLTSDFREQEVFFPQRREPPLAPPVLGGRSSPAVWGSAEGAFSAAPGSGHDGAFWSVA